MGTLVVRLLAVVAGTAIGATALVFFTAVGIIALSAFGVVHMPI